MKDQTANPQIDWPGQHPWRFTLLVMLFAVPAPFFVLGVVLAIKRHSAGPYLLAFSQIVVTAIFIGFVVYQHQQRQKLGLKVFVGDYLVPPSRWGIRGPIRTPLFLFLTVITWINLWTISFRFTQSWLISTMAVTQFFLLIWPSTLMHWSRWAVHEKGLWYFGALPWSYFNAYRCEDGSVTLGIVGSAVPLKLMVAEQHRDRLKSTLMSALDDVAPSCEEDSVDGGARDERCHTGNAACT